jgi:hypothetical protein
MIELVPGATPAVEFLGAVGRVSVTMDDEAAVTDRHTDGFGFSEG